MYLCLPHVQPCQVLEQVNCNYQATAAQDSSVVYDIPEVTASLAPIKTDIGGDAILYEFPQDPKTEPNPASMPHSYAKMKPDKINGE